MASLGNSRTHHFEFFRNIASGDVSLTALHLETLKCSLGSHFKCVEIGQNLVLHLLHRLSIENLCLLLHHLATGRVECRFGPGERRPLGRSATYGSKCVATVWMSKSIFTLPNLFLPLSYNTFMGRNLQSAVKKGKVYECV